MSTENVNPTRINLIQTKKTLNLAESGRSILEKKRDILLRELRHSIYDAERAREDLNEVLAKAYESLRQANIANGSEVTANVALGSSIVAEFLLDHRSIMGVTIPKVEFKGPPQVKPDYGFGNTSAELDKAFKLFYQALERIADLSESEGTVFQVARDMRRTQRRANALTHVLIPKYKETVKRIELVLEEKEREEFVRTKRTKKLIREREVV
jgi:V/A-type H+/Na+-transporting ATPase subunit D